MSVEYFSLQFQINIDWTNLKIIITNGKGLASSVAFLNGGDISDLEIWEKIEKEQIALNVN